VNLSSTPKDLLVRAEKVRPLSHSLCRKSSVSVTYDSFPDKRKATSPRTARRMKTFFALQKMAKKELSRGHSAEEGHKRFGTSMDEDDEEEEEEEEEEEDEFLYGSKEMFGKNNLRPGETGVVVLDTMVPLG
jgi:hypothetical protein